MTDIRVFNSDAYLALDAKRLRGIATRAPSVAGLIARTIPGQDLGDLVSVYGYPDLVLEDVGQPFETDAFVEDITAFGRASGFVSAYLRLGLEGDLLTPSDSGMAALVDVGDVVSVDLGRPIPEIVAGYRKQLRYELRQPHQFRFERSADATVFHQMYTENMTRVQAQAQYFFSRDYLTVLCQIPGVELCLAMDDQGPVAGAIVISQGARLFYHLGATADRIFPASPLKYLLADIIEKHANGTYCELVLGGGFGGGSDSLLRFKRGFSKATRRVKALRIILDPYSYDSLGGAAASPTIKDGFFPAYRNPQRKAV